LKRRELIKKIEAQGGVLILPWRQTPLMDELNLILAA
jgi:hypothetical protein